MIKLIPNKQCALVELIDKYEGIATLKEKYNTLINGVCLKVGNKNYDYLLNKTLYWDEFKAGDKKIHFDHIVDSGQYNLRHDHDHAKELAFDYQRLSKEKPTEAKRLQSQTVRFLNPIYNKMGLKLERK